MAIDAYEDGNVQRGCPSDGGAWQWSVTKSRNVGPRVQPGARSANQCASATPTAAPPSGLGVAVSQLPLASVALPVPEAAVESSADESAATQTPPNTAPPTATRGGLGEGQHLHGAGVGRRTAQKPLARRSVTRSAAEALPVSPRGGNALCSDDEGDPMAVPEQHDVDIEALCISNERRQRAAIAGESASSILAARLPNQCASATPTATCQGGLGDAVK